MVPESSGHSARMRPDDRLIACPEVRRIMGDIATSTVYTDPDLLSLRIYLTAGAVRWIEREIYGLRDQRVALSGEREAATRAKVEQQRDRRRRKQMNVA
jgi:predicted DNA-binding transcriptional regulator AlpA